MYKLLTNINNINNFKIQTHSSIKVKQVMSDLSLLIQNQKQVVVDSAKVKQVMSMSDLSLLIQNQKQVIVDKNYLQKCTGDQPKSKQKNIGGNSSQNRVLSFRDIKINGNFMPNKRKATSPRSYNLNNLSSMKSQTSDTNEELYKIGMRVDALDQNQKRLQSKFAKQFANLHQTIYKKKGQYSDMMAELNNIKGDIGQCKKMIGQVLNQITAKPK